MAVLKVQNKGNKGNPYHKSNDGTFTSQNEDGSTNNKNDNTKNTSSFLKKKDTNNNFNLPSYLKKTNGQNSNVNSNWKKFKENQFWKKRKLMTPDELEANIDKFFDDEICNFLSKYNFKTTNNLGAGNTSHSRINTTLTNAIAQKQFVPLKIIDSKEFDKLVSKNMPGDTNKIPFQEYSFIQRGFHNKEIIDTYLGKKQNDCLLPNGAFGSCIYTAYDGYTANMYANGSNGYVMSFLVDNKNGKTITSSEYYTILSDVRKRIPNMKEKIIKKLKENGKDENYSNNIARIFENTIGRDYTFAGLLLGYDAIYQTSQRYCLVLNWKNISTKKDW